MGVLRYYWTVIKLAFTQTPGIAQDFLFGAFIASGIILWVLKHAGIVTDPDSWMAQITGWQIAVAVLGSIFIIRLVLAPYWLYLEQAAALASAAKRDGHAPENVVRRNLSWLTMADAVTAYCDPVLVARRDKYGDGFESAYMRAYEIEKEMAKVLNDGPTPGLSYPGAQEQYVKLREKKDRHDHLARLTQDGLRDTWKDLRADLENRLLRGELVACGFLEPHVGGHAEVEITAAEWRILACDPSNGTAVKSDTNALIYSGVQIASLKVATPTPPSPPSTAPEAPL